MKIQLITVYLPKPMIQGLDSLVEDKRFPHRAEAIRVAIRDLLVFNERWHINTTESHLGVEVKDSTLQAIDAFSEEGFSRRRTKKPSKSRGRKRQRYKKKNNK